MKVRTLPILLGLICSIFVVAACNNQVTISQNIQNKKGQSNNKPQWIKIITVKQIPRGDKIINAAPEKNGILVALSVPATANTPPGLQMALASRNGVRMIGRPITYPGENLDMSIKHFNISETGKGKPEMAWTNGDGSHATFVKWSKGKWVEEQTPVLKMPSGVPTSIIAMPLLGLNGTMWLVYVEATDAFSDTFNHNFKEIVYRYSVSKKWQKLWEGVFRTNADFGRLLIFNTMPGSVVVEINKARFLVVNKDGSTTIIPFPPHAHMRGSNVSATAVYPVTRSKIYVPVARLSSSYDELWRFSAGEWENIIVKGSNLQNADMIGILNGKPILEKFIGYGHKAHLYSWNSRNGWQQTNITAKPGIIVTNDYGIVAYTPDGAWIWQGPAIGKV